MRFEPLDTLIGASLGTAFPAAQVAVRLRGELVYHQAFGQLDPEAGGPTTDLDTRFDLASVSKLFCVAAFMSLVDAGRVGLDTPVRAVLPEFRGLRPIAPYPDPLHPGGLIEVVPPGGPEADASGVTFRNLLAHNSGLAAWLPFWRKTLRNEGPVEKTDKHLWRVIEDPGALAEKRVEMRRMALESAFAYPTGARVVYSDVGLILIGFAVEALTGMSLDQAVAARVTRPLGLGAGYGPVPLDNCAPTEFYAHQGRRMRGQVHDENCYAFGGVTGHAGLFATAHDVSAFGEHLRQALAGTAADPLLRQATLAEMTRLQAEDGNVRRGLGFALWSPLDRAASNPLSRAAFGHLGFTGTALWMDPARALTFACLTNHVYYGRNSPDTLTDFRVAFSRAVAACIDAERAPDN